MAKEKTEKFDISKVDPETKKAMEALVARLQGATKEVLKKKEAVDKQLQAEYENQYKGASVKVKLEPNDLSVDKSTKCTHIFLDDERVPSRVDWAHIPEGVNWYIARDFDSFKEYIEKHGVPTYVSFDYMLGAGKKDGAECAQWLVNHCIANDFKLPQWICHSQSLVGVKKIDDLMFNFGKLKKKAKELTNA